MKLKDAVVGKYVFLKKSAPEYTGVERAFLIRDIVHNKGGSTRAVLENEMKLDLCKLTDIPCS